MICEICEELQVAGPIIFEDVTWLACRKCHEQFRGMPLGAQRIAAKIHKSISKLPYEGKEVPRTISKEYTELPEKEPAPDMAPPDSYIVSWCYDRWLAVSEIAPPLMWETREGKWVEIGFCYP